MTLITNENTAQTAFKYPLRLFLKLLGAAVQVRNIRALSPLVNFALPRVRSLPLQRAEAPRKSRIGQHCREDLFPVLCSDTFPLKARRTHPASRPLAGPTTALCTLGPPEPAPAQDCLRVAWVWSAGRLALIISVCLGPETTLPDPNASPNRPPGRGPKISAARIGNCCEGDASEATPLTRSWPASSRRASRPLPTKLSGPLAAVQPLMSPPPRPSLRRPRTRRSNKR